MSSDFNDNENENNSVNNYSKIDGNLFSSSDKKNNQNIEQKR